MRTSFYVTTADLDKPNHEHTYRLPAGDSIPEGQKLVSQRPAGLFRLSSVLSDDSFTALLDARSEASKRVRGKK